MIFKVLDFGIRISRRSFSACSHQCSQLRFDCFDGWLCFGISRFVPPQIYDFGFPQDCRWFACELIPGPHHFSGRRRISVCKCPPWATTIAFTSFRILTFKHSWPARSEFRSGILSPSFRRAGRCLIILRNAIQTKKSFLGPNWTERVYNLVLRCCQNPYWWRYAPLTSHGVIFHTNSSPKRNMSRAITGCWIHFLLRTERCALHFSTVTHDIHEVFCDRP